GVPRGLAGLTHAFQYNDIHALQSIGDMYGGQLAAIVLEPVRGQEPTPEFVAAINEMARKTGAILIIDEVTAGLRLNTGGAHLLYGYEPDIAVFAKALGNGFPIAAIVGKRRVMEAAQETFISSTTWTERVGPVAALATLRKHRDENVATHLIRFGERIKEGWLEIAQDADLDISVSGIAPLAHFSFKNNPTESKTLFTQEMLDRGILATTSFYTMFSHTDDHVNHYLEQAAGVFAIIAEAQGRGDVSKHLRGPVAHTGFHRLTG
ncbi:MAG: aminotransferase class III-fold pyridoxal phosphate-dependent enzyme, partial [Fimbriimonadaceae bacterium]|nr:aminotransferase class III-fold pyridoxal phosphate-dependent enzyme [Alphaproteobacteria bacterium]